MPANDRQVAGDHYGGGEYQHWDWASNCNLHYLAGAASKYVARARRKNGIEDLLKAAHYIQKAEELALRGSCVAYRTSYFWRFALENKLTLEEGAVCWYIMEGEWEAAASALLTLIQSVGK